MEKIIKIITNIIGLFITLFLTPVILTCISWYLFPNIKATFIQMLWIFFCIWMGIQYVTISIETSIKGKK